GEIKKRIAGVEVKAEGALRYRGVYAGAAEASKYRQGDCVTHGGCLFYAYEDAPAGKPGDGANTGWVLMAKSADAPTERRVKNVTIQRDAEGQMTGARVTEPR